MHFTKIDILPFITVTLILVSSCTNDKSEQTEKAKYDAHADSAALHVAIMPVDECLPAIVAKNIGIFDSLGVDVRLKQYRAVSECQRAMEKKRVEGTIVDSAVTWRFLTAKRSRISRREQLADKIIGADMKGATYALAKTTTDSLEKKGEMVYIVQVEDLKVRYDMLHVGNVDAALLPEPFATKALQEGAREIKLPKNTSTHVHDKYQFAADALKSPERQRQISLFRKAIAIANDSISRFGKDHYRPRK